GESRHADEAAAADVHLAKRRQSADIGEVRADSPSPWAPQMTRQVEAERDRRVAAVSGDRHGRTNGTVRADAPSGAAATETRSSLALLDERAAHPEPRLEADTGRNGRLKQPPVEIAPDDRAANAAIWIPPLDRDAVCPGETHAGHRQPAVLDRRRQPEAS